MQRIVHLDMKGAPLKIPYLERVILAAKSWGATGILLEWEDTFPFSGELADLGSQGVGSGDEMYSLEEVRYILQFIQENGLEAIQLVQTIGHMEYVLKHPAFRDLREQTRSPAVLCPSKEMSQKLVRMMLDQILDIQPNAKYLHIGADEVWHQAICVDCKRVASESKYKNADLFLKHVRDLSLYVKQKRPELNILMWDDMLRNMTVEALRDYSLGQLVQPVVWNYSSLEHFTIEEGMWRAYRFVFPTLWAASAFKGANGSCKLMSPASRYVSNHEAWNREIKKIGSEINFSGIILTGWSRYDHYAAMCELMPVSMSSLASCLKTLSNTDANHKLCDENTRPLPSDEWPFEELARTLHAFVDTREEATAFIHSEVVATWLNPWQVERGYTNPSQIDGIANTAHQFHTRLTSLKPALENYLHAMTGRRSVAEWIGTYFTPILSGVEKTYRDANERRQMNASVKPILD